MNRAISKRSKQDLIQEDDEEKQDEDVVHNREVMGNDDEEGENYNDNQNEEDAFFDSVLNTAQQGSTGTSDNHMSMFTELNLSRPLLRGVEAAGYTTPTPVQVRLYRQLIN